MNGNTKLYPSDSNILNFQDDCCDSCFQDPKFEFDHIAYMHLAK